MLVESISFMLWNLQVPRSGILGGMDTYSIVIQILKILSLAMPAIYYGYKFWKEIRMDKTKKSEPSVRISMAHCSGVDIDVSIH